MTIMQCRKHPGVPAHAVQTQVAAPPLLSKAVRTGKGFSGDQLRQIAGKSWSCKALVPDNTRSPLSSAGTR